MDISTQTDGADDAIDDSKIVKTIFIHTQPPRIHVLKSVDIALKSSQLDRLFNSRYPEIMFGRDLASVIDLEEGQNFLKDWFCNQTLPFIASHLLKLKPTEFLKILSQKQNQTENNQTFADMLEGRTVVRESQLTEIIKSVAKELEDQYKIDYNLAHRICFVLVLAPVQRNKHLQNIPIQANFDNHVSLLDLVRIKLIEHILNNQY